MDKSKVRKSGQGIFDQFGPIRMVHFRRKMHIDNKIERARDLLLDNDIDAINSRTIKAESNNKISILEAKLSELNI